MPAMFGTVAIKIDLINTIKAYQTCWNANFSNISIHRINGNDTAGVAR